jgi:hypothetical protein
MALTRLARYSRNRQHRRFVAALVRINRRMSRDWFSLFVVNGFVAWVSAMVFGIVQQFSWTQILWNVISAALHPVFQMLVSLAPGANWLGRWISWYGQNQVKFVFWLLYSAAICDDLGLPNYKTLFVWMRRRFKRFIQTAIPGVAKSAEPSP